MENKESIDINTYRLAESKASEIGEIEILLKSKKHIKCFFNHISL